MAARTLNRLTDTAIRQAEKAGRMADGGGLYLAVAESGSKAWVFMWVVDKKRKEMGLGSYPTVTLKRARDKAAACRIAVADGKNPIEERKREKAVTFTEAAEAYLKSREKLWRSAKHKDQWRATLGLRDEGIERKVIYCADLVELPVGSITKDDLVRSLKPVWDSRPETAMRLRSRIEKVLDFARINGWCSGENPARWKGHLEYMFAVRSKDSKSHFAAMPYQDVPAFMQTLRSREAMAARVLEFQILTAARSGEAIGAAWPEIDLERAVWTVPKERMKAGEEHLVPLSEAAVALLKPLHANRVAGHVFPGNALGGPLSNMAGTMLLRRMGVPFTSHGFRSAFRDWAGDCTDFPREVAEAALAHKVGNVVEQAYRRGSALEKRRRLMETWARFCTGEKPASNIMNLRA